MLFYDKHFYKFKMFFCPIGKGNEYCLVYRLVGKIVLLSNVNIKSVRDEIISFRSSGRLITIENFYQMRIFGHSEMSDVFVR